jgi:uncharacterized protein YozE (UPF0346 family)
MAEENTTPSLQQDYENITPWNGANDRGRDVRLKWERNFNKIKSNFQVILNALENPVFPSSIQIGKARLVYDVTNKAIKVILDDDTPANLYTTGGLSAYGDGLAGGAGGGGLIQTVYGYADLGSAFLDTNKTNTFNAYTIAKIAQRLSEVEQGALTSVTWSIINGTPTSLLGYGITDAAPLSHAQNTTIHLTAEEKTWIGQIKALLTKDGDNIKVNTNLYATGGISALGQSTGGGSADGIDEALMWSILGNTGTEQISKNHLTTALSGYLTSHQSLAGYATESWVLGKNYLTSHQSLSDYIKSVDVDSLVSSLHGQINNLNARNQFDELFASYGDFETISAERIFGVLDWSYIGGRPTTLAGYGITDAVWNTDSRLTNARPASDVYSWAKQSTKPSYSYSEIGSTPTSMKNPYSISWSGYNSGSYDGSSANSFYIPYLTSQISESGNLYYTTARVQSDVDALCASLQDQINRLAAMNQFDDLFAQYVESETMASNIVHANIVQIGNVRLVYDSSNNAIKVIGANGASANLYATGGITALS